MFIKDKLLRARKRLYFKDEEARNVNYVNEGNNRYRFHHKMKQKKFK
jgi:hypothetical protein